MVKILRLAVLVLVLSGLYFYRADLKNYLTKTIKENKDTVQVEKLNNVVDKINQIAETKKLPVGRCDKPLVYSIGNFDPKFNIPQDTFLSVIKEAESIWESAIGKNLFEYNQENGAMSVNLVYDYRQETTDKLKDLGIVVEQNRSSYEEVKSRYNLAKSSYTKSKIIYDNDVAVFNKLNNEYQSQVTYWNNRGGAPQDEYNKLTSAKLVLEAEANRLNNNLAILREMVNQVNGLANTLNKLVEVLNLNVNKYNSIGSTLGDSFEEGLYKQDGDFRSIDIYEYQNHDQLVRVLTHELGHSLGIGHLEEKDAIMHYINISKSIKLTDADKSALKAACGLTY
jgi:hypothetical protein